MPNLIVALDFNNLKEAERMVNILGEEVDFYKIGSMLFFSSGKEVILMLNKLKKRVFLDLKFHDIPYVIEKVCEEVAKLGVFMCSAHILGGKEMLKCILNKFALTQSTFGFTSKTLLVGITLLSSLSLSWPKEIGLNIDSSSIVLNLAKLGKEVGLDGLVVAPQDAPFIRRHFGKELLLISPGIRTNSYPSLREHKRGAALEEVVPWVDYIVVGRPIITAPDPISAVKEIKKTFL
jgi:orotidine-5'-phosphate decarboxylase